MDKKQQAFAMYIAEKFGVQSPQEIEQVIKGMSEDELQNLAMEFEEVWKSQGSSGQEAQPRMAKLGAKLERVKAIMNRCASDEELVSYKIGGKICTKCVKKDQKGAKVQPKKQSVKDEFNKNKKKEPIMAKKGESWSDRAWDEYSVDTNTGDHKTDSIAFERKKEAMTAYDKKHKLGKFAPSKKAQGGILQNLDFSKIDMEVLKCGGKMKKKKKEEGGLISKAKGEVVITASPQDSQDTKPKGGWKIKKNQAGSRITKEPIFYDYQEGRNEDGRRYRTESLSQNWKGYNLIRDPEYWNVERTIYQNPGLPNDTIYTGDLYKKDGTQENSIAIKNRFNQGIRRNEVKPTLEHWNDEEYLKNPSGETRDQFLKRLGDQWNHLNQSRVNLRKQREGQ